MINAGSFKLSTFLARHVKLFFFFNSSFMEPKSYYLMIFIELGFCIQEEWDLNNSLNDLPSERESFISVVKGRLLTWRHLHRRSMQGVGVQCNFMNIKIIWKGFNLGKEGKTWEIFLDPGYLFVTTYCRSTRAQESCVLRCTHCWRSNIQFYSL